MPYIGSRKQARYALMMSIEGRVFDDWKMIGSGSFRTCYLHKPSGVVYKVESDFREEGYDNWSELKNARKLLRKCIDNDQWLDEYIRIPKVSGYRIGDELVIAMQYIAGDIGADATNTSALRALYNIGFQDMHAANFISDDEGSLWPIDLASPLPGHPAYSAADERALRAAEW